MALFVRREANLVVDKLQCSGQIKQGHNMLLDRPAFAPEERADGASEPPRRRRGSEPFRQAGPALCGNRASGGRSLCLSDRHNPDEWTGDSAIAHGGRRSGRMARMPSPRPNSPALAVGVETPVRSSSQGLAAQSDPFGDAQMGALPVALASSMSRAKSSAGITVS